MWSILVYGDSQTWGMKPTKGAPEPVRRHDPPDRWPNVLAAKLNGAAEIICEGLCGRTTAYDDHLSVENRNGAAVLPTVLGTHAPLDLVIIMLGANDLKCQQAGSAYAAMRGMARLIEIVRFHPFVTGTAIPAVLIVSPPTLSATDNFSFNQIFAGARGQSMRLASLYRELAEQQQCSFFDAGMVVRTSPVDGVHLDALNSRLLGEALAERVHAILAGS